MDGLSAALNMCLPLLEGKLIYLDYPVHNNVGDLLIWLGGKKLFARNGKKFLGQYSFSNMGRHAEYSLGECRTICFHGGGNLGDLYPLLQNFRERIIRQYPEKRIVMLPQSAHFENVQALKDACRIFKSHPDLHIFLRDRHSHALLANENVPNLALCPDMAHALWHSLDVPVPGAGTTEPLYLFRRDKEAAQLPPELAHEKLISVDWEDLIKGWIWRIYSLGIKTNELDARDRLNNLLPACSIWGAVVNLLINRAVRLFAPHETIVTNRLHAVILAALMGRRVIAYDNSYGKLSSYIDCWLGDMPHIELRKT